MRPFKVSLNTNWALSANRVHLLVNEKSMNAIAAKIIDMNKNKDHLNAILKEVSVAGEKNETKKG